jgi:hypothetical protein
MQKLMIAAALAIALAGGVVAVGPAGLFAEQKSSMDGGGGRSKSASFALTGTVGQPDAGTQVAGSASFNHANGFWARLVVMGDLIFNDGFEPPEEEPL